MIDADIIPSDMRMALERFDDEAKQIFDAFARPMESKPIPAIIYHYTNDTGLKGILETGALWLSDIFNLNDPSELSHGFSHAVDSLRNAAANGPPESKFFAERFASFITEGGIQASAHYFVCCFSTDGDDLGQWRAYADNGRGYALGFDAEVLENRYAKGEDGSIPDHITCPITYDDSQLASLQRQIVEKAFPLISLPRGRNLQNSAVNSYMAELSSFISARVVLTALLFKHEAYQNEQEYRFIEWHRADMRPPNMKLRMRPHSLVRYREFDWRTAADGALRRIVVGPAADHDKAVKFVRDCLVSFHPGEVEVVRSRIPYRAT